MGPNRGFLYVATGDEFVEEAILSARYLKRVSELGVTLVTDSHVDADAIDTVITLEDPYYSFGDQIAAMQQTPYDETVFLDSDVLVAENPEDVFSLLHRFDIAASQAPVRVQNSDCIPASIPNSFPEYNSGVVAYRLNDRTQRFLEHWADIYSDHVAKGYDRNQPSFRQAIYESDVRISTLPPEYNCRYQFPGQVTGPVKIFHGRLKDIHADSGGTQHLMDIETVASKINEKTGPRVHYPRGHSIAVKNMEDALLYRLLLSVRSDGVTSTLRKALKKLR